MDGTKPVPSLNNFSNFDLPSPKGSVARGSLTGWTDDPTVILRNKSQKKVDTIQNSPVKKETTNGTVLEPRPQRRIKTVSRKSNTRNYIIKRESSLENTRSVVQDLPSTIKPGEKPVDKKVLENENKKYKEDSVILETGESQNKELVSRKTSLKSKRRDLKEIFQMDMGGDGSASVESRARSSSQTFYPKLKPRQPSIKNKEAQNISALFNESRLNKSILGRNISIGSPSPKDSVVFETYAARMELKTSLGSKRHEDESKLYKTIEGHGNKINTKPERKKAMPIKSSKNANNKFMRKNFMGISMLINTSKSGSLKNKYINEKTLNETPIHIEENERYEDSRHVFRKYLDKISRPQRNAIGQFKEKLLGMQWTQLRDSVNSNYTNHTSEYETEKEKDRSIAYNVPYTKGVENRIRIKRLETESSKTFNPKTGGSFGSPLRVTTYHSPMKFPTSPNKYLNDQLARIDFNF